MSLRFSLLLVLLGLSCNQLVAATATCHTITSNDLTFCSSMVGQSTDSFFATTAWNGLNYFQYIDGVVQSVYNSFVADINASAKKDGIATCTSCMDQFKYLLCAGTFPKCGYYDCMLNVLSEALNSVCPPMCQCLNCVDEFTGNCTNKNPNYNITQAASCNFNSLSSVLVSDFAQCSSYFVSSVECNNLVNVCSCNKANSASLCTIFSPNGFTVPNWPTGSCSSSAGWCSATGTRSLEARDSNSFCPNQALCLTVPGPIAVSATTGGAGGVGASQVSPSAYTFVSSPGGSKSSNAMAVVYTPLLLIVALFFAVLLA